MNKLNATKLRTSAPTPDQIETIKRNDIYIILDNVLDTYNVGAIFRLSDAVAAKKIYLCGGTEMPPNSRIEKSSIGTWRWIPWEYVPTAQEAVTRLKNQISNIKVVAVELDERAIPYDEYDYSLPIALIVGHETDGVTPEALAASDAIVQLPQLGINVSLNVMVSLGITLYEVLEKNNIR